MSAGNVSGHLLILHDLNYIDQREREARAYTIVALLTVSSGFGLLTLALFLALNRNWTRSIRNVLSDARQGAALQPSEPGPFFVNKEVTALLAEFRVERKFTQGIHIVWSPGDSASTARRRIAGRASSDRLELRALYPYSNGGRR